MRKNGGRKQQRFTKPPLVILSLDGFAADYLNYNIVQTFDHIAACGAKSSRMYPVYPSLTYPNHFSIVTGLHPQNHGIIDEKIYDQESKEFVDVRNASMVGKFLNSSAEMIWNKYKKVENQQMKIKIFGWPGIDESSVDAEEFENPQPNEKLRGKLLKIVELLKQAATGLILAHHSDLERIGYSSFMKNGKIDRVKKELENIDEDLDYFMKKLREADILDCVNLVIVSDHDMSNMWKFKRDKAISEQHKAEKELDKKSKRLENSQRLNRNHRDIVSTRDKQLKALENLLGECLAREDEKFKKDYGTVKNAASKKRRREFLWKHVKKLAGGPRGCGEFLRDLLKELSGSDEIDASFKLTPEEGFYVFHKLGISKQKQAKLKKYLRHLLKFDVFPSRYSIEKLEKIFGQDELFDVKLIVDPETGKKHVVGLLKNLDEMASIRLSALAAANKLMFRDDGKGKVMFGVFCDKGGGWTKLIGIFGDTHNPNSCYHALPLVIFEGEDTAADLRKYCPEVLEQLKNFKQVSFSVDGQIVVKDVEQFLGGDMKFLCSVYGHKGATSSSNCPLCLHINRDGSKLADFDPNKEYTLRTLKTLATCAKTGTKGIYKDSSVVFYWIPLENVIPPSLHVIMGLAQKYAFNVLLDMAHVIDLETAGIVVTDENKKISEHNSELKKLKGTMEKTKRITATWKADLKNIENVMKSLDNIASNSIQPSKCSAICGASFCLYKDKAMKTTSSKQLPQFECDICEDKVHEVCAAIWTEDERASIHDPIDDSFTCATCTGLTTPALLKSAATTAKTMINERLEELEKEMKTLGEKYVTLKEIVVDGMGEKRKELEETWSSLGADMSAWHQTFSGNHVYKLLSETAIDEYMSIFPSNEKTDNIRKFIGKLGSLQRMCHSDFFSDGEIEELKSTIFEMIEPLKKALPYDTITLKLHILVSHVPVFAKLHRTWAKMCEHLQFFINLLISLQFFIILLITLQFFINLLISIQRLSFIS
ncbi:unnamed protein product [Caenorhabditis angaria]|uniref:Uncharacterized protein n=1 Tax=Caenorhabditis angaria TaxID=860376 RepID=A0A9P1IW43_9PELO|nr:unnamed protein product [Caenorhabditis angaria]